MGPMRQEAHQGGAEETARREVTLGKLLWREVTLSWSAETSGDLAGDSGRSAET